MGPEVHVDPPRPRRREVTDLDGVGAYCPTCGAEYRPGFDTCADDGTPLVPGAAPEPAPGPVVAPGPPGPPARWAPLAQFNREEEARLLAGRLQAEGIEARVYPEWRPSYFGEVPQVPISVLVPEYRVPEARAVVQRLEQGVSPEDD